MAADIIVEFRAVTKRFGNVEVLKGVDAQFYEGETHVICGPSGVGKSTLLRCINYLETVDSGTVLFRGVPVNRKTAREIRKRVGMVFQHFNLFPHLTALENATLGLRKVLGFSRKAAEEKVIPLFERVGLADKLSAYPYQLSGGQKQRVGIVRALAMDPELILFDEPTSALDPEMINEVLGVMKDLAAEGRSMIVVTHELAFAKAAAHRISMMFDGRIVETKPPEEFFNNPEHPATRRFLQQINRE